MVQAEQWSQIVNLLGQVRELRGAVDEAEADRTALEQGKTQLGASPQQHCARSRKFGQILV